MIKLVKVKVNIMIEITLRIVITVVKVRRHTSERRVKYRTANRRK